jgi:hypothetical protein
VSAQRSSWREKKRDASKEAWRHDAIHCGNFYGGQRSDRRGERRRGTRVQSTAASLLHQWGTIRFQNLVPTCIKTTLRPPDHLPQTLPLF